MGRFFIQRSSFAIGSKRGGDWGCGTAFEAASMGIGRRPDSSGPSHPPSQFSTQNTLCQLVASRNFGTGSGRAKGGEGAYRGGALPGPLGHARGRGRAPRNYRRPNHPPVAALSESRGRGPLGAGFRLRGGPFLLAGGQEKITGARLRGRRRHLCGVGARSGGPRQVIKPPEAPPCPIRSTPRECSPQRGR